MGNSFVSISLSEMSSNNTTIDSELSGAQPVEIFWTVSFSLIVLTSVLGNSLVIWIVSAHRRMWSVTNYFLLNLSVADILMASLNCSVSFIYMRDRVWNFGPVYCCLNQ